MSAATHPTKFWIAKINSRADVALYIDSVEWNTGMQYWIEQVTQMFDNM